MKTGVIVDISSNSAYQIPKIMIPKNTYRLAEKHEQAFLDKLLRMCKGQLQERRTCLCAV